MISRKDPWAVRVRCSLHAVVSEVWVTCIHTDAIRSARRVSANGGEALCEACEADSNANRLNPAVLRLACGGCVRKRWRIRNAS